MCQSLAILATLLEWLLGSSNQGQYRQTGTAGVGKLENQESNLWVPGPSQAKSLSIVPDPSKQKVRQVCGKPLPGEGMRPSRT